MGACLCYAFFMADKNDKRIVLYLDAATAAELELVAVSADRPVSWLARYIVSRWLERERERAQS